MQDNLALLRRRGVHIVPPEEGRLAGGDSGAGRLASPETIVAAVASAVSDAPAPSAASEPAGASMAGLHVLITAGGTREAIDPVRFIGNRSTGKQGYALADEAAVRGAQVTLVSTVERPVHSSVTVVPVVSAQDMLAAVRGHADSADIVIMAAAVADFRPVDVSDRKIKKADGVPTVALERTVDILKELGASKRPGQTVVGFAAETDDLVANASRKLAAKGADFIVANDVSAPNVGFGHDTNEVTILAADGTSASVSLASKQDVARAVLTAVEQARASAS